MRRMVGTSTPRKSNSLLRYAFSWRARSGLAWTTSAFRIASARPEEDLVEFGENVLTECLDPLRLVAADVVQIDAVEA
jgi:hypothetical protein